MSVFPNLLGFGIGVYGLVFGLSANFLKAVQEQLKHAAQDQSKSKTSCVAQKSVLMLNADMAYPLLVMTLTIVVGVVSKVYSANDTVQIVALILFWYSLLMLLEILVALFNMGEALLMTKVASSGDGDDK